MTQIQIKHLTFVRPDKGQSYWDCGPFTLMHTPITGLDGISRDYWLVGDNRDMFKGSGATPQEAWNHLVRSYKRWAAEHLDLIISADTPS